jgi:ATP-dependent 26S proteasome regulatory subunit
MPDTKNSDSKVKAPPPKLVQKILLDASAPMQMRCTMLRQLAIDDGDHVEPALAAILEAAAANGAESAFKEKLAEMEAGPLRSGTYLQTTLTAAGRRAKVVLTDGTTLYSPVPDDEVAEQLRCGDTVWLEAQGKAVLFSEAGAPRFGEEARLERTIDDAHAEVTVREHDRHVYRMSADLRDQIAAGEAEPGSAVLICPQRMMAFGAVPEPDGMSHYRFLAPSEIPDVVIERDIGDPPPFLGEVLEDLRYDLLHPGSVGRHGLSQSRMLMLAGVSGGGKTHCIYGLWNALYALMSEVTGAPVDDLPPRVMRFRAAEVLSKWLGDSDKAIDRFFAEALEIADRRFICADGREITLPTMVLLEEADGIARERGDEPVYDRVLTTLLDRLDPSRSELRRRSILFLCTTNVPHLLDAAFLRRAGAEIVRFGRLGRRSFQAVLDKQLGTRRFSTAGFADARAARARAVADLTAWLFAANGADKGQLEVTYVGATTPAIQYRRDLLTPALVARAVEQAARAARRAECRGEADAGLTSERLMRALDAQAAAIADQINPRNAHNYLTLPDDARVGTVRRIAQPAILPIELERAS